MARRNPYTTTERSTVLKWLQQFPDNIRHAISKAAEELTARTAEELIARTAEELIARTATSLTTQYYSVWRNEEDFRALTVGSKEGFTHNIKNTPRVEGVFPEERVLNSVGWLVKNFLNLSSKEQKQFTDILVSIGTINIANPVIKGNNNKVSIR